MLPKVDSNSTCSYATIRYLTDAERNITVPVGVALWNKKSHWFRVRLPQENERIKDVSAASAIPHLEAARAKIEGWLRRGELPYATEPLAPLSDQWWDHVQRLMQFSVRIEPPHPVDCLDPDEDIERLFVSLVRPQVSTPTRTQRVDGAIGRALGASLSTRFHRGQVPGFGGRPVEVQRLAQAGDQAVIVEGVNLASADAERDAGAMESRLCRIKESGTAINPRFVLGYLASAGGLNGEAALKEWIEYRVAARMYDLRNEQQEFREAAGQAIAALDDARECQGSLE
jgi:hypothetical protein